MVDKKSLTQTTQMSLPQAGEGCGQLIFRVQTKMYKLQCRLKAGLYGRHAGQRRE